MAVVLHSEIEKLKQMALAVGTQVEGALRDAVRAFRERDADLARSVLRRDAEIDKLEVDVEEECLKILALHQPVAIDLRLIIAIIKLNNDLERIGDLAADIAERAAHLAGEAPLKIPDELPPMAASVQGMLKKSLDALVNFDASLARAVLREDDSVDAMHRDMFPRIQSMIADNPDRVHDLFQLLSVSRYLERIADHATNIAEDVIYLVEGDIIRHQAEEQRAD